MQYKTIGMLKIGDSATFTKTISESDVYTFAGVTGDFNPAHVNKVYADNSMFKDRIAHGLLTAGFISTVLGTKLPGVGTIYLGQSLKFKKPVYIGDTITAKVVVDKIITEKNIIECQTICLNQHDEVVIIGTATVMPPRSKK